MLKKNGIVNKILLIVSLVSWSILIITKNQSWAPVALVSTLLLVPAMFKLHSKLQVQKQEKIEKGLKITKTSHLKILLCGTALLGTYLGIKALINDFSIIPSLTVFAMMGYCIKELKKRKYSENKNDEKMQNE